MSAEKVIGAARGELGTTEWPKGSNRVKYWEAYDKAMQGQPWCVGFLWWCFNEAGERTAFMGGGKTASCSTLLRWYREQGQTVDVAQVQPGDIVILNFSGTKDTQHCGLVEGISNYGNRYDGYGIYTIEGNTSPGAEGSQDNGGCVALKTRYPKNIVGVCRPMYKNDEPKDDVSGHWAEASIRKAMARGAMTGYPDGTWLPEKPVTRAELAAVLDRLKLI